MIFMVTAWCWETAMVLFKTTWFGNVWHCLLWLLFAMVWYTWSMATWLCVKTDLRYTVYSSYFCCFVRGDYHLYCSGLNTCPNHETVEDHARSHSVLDHLLFKSTI